MPQDVFLSYSRVDIAFVERFNAFLNQVEVTTWFDKQSLLAGQRWEDIIEEEIPRSRIFISCLSKGGLSKHGFFHAEQALAEKAALQIPRDEVFIMPIKLGDCDIPRSLKQFNTINLIEPRAIELLLASLSSALDRKITASQDQQDKLRTCLVEHLGAESLSNAEFENRFMDTDNLSFQDSMGLVERIANSSDSEKVKLLLKLRGLPFISYAEQAALDRAIDNAKGGQKTEQLQETIKQAELKRIEQMRLNLSASDNQLMQINKYFRYIARKNTETYTKAERHILQLVQKSQETS